jgi:phosphatidylserine/phosphatidylglycerophosphate/cardiolipin synthase-like enzyme
VSHEEPADLGQRIRSIVSTVASELTGTDTPPLLDAAARALGATLERWSRNPNLRRFLGGVQRDVLTGQGEYVELVANLGVSAKLGSHARFCIGDEVVADVAIEEGVDAARAIVIAPGPGLHRIGIKICTDKGDEISEIVGHRLLHVAGERPVVLVDAELVLPYPEAAAPPPVKTADALQALVDAGFELAYFDIHTRNRDALIHAAVTDQKLPPGAIIAYSAIEQELRGLELGFLEMFATSAIRRLRGRGVPVTSVLTERDPDSDRAAAERVSVFSREDAVGLKPGDLHAEFQQAKEFFERRSESDLLDWRLDQTTDSTLVAGNSFHAELDNERARNRLFKVIDEATRSIHIQLYIVRPSDFAERLIVRLIRRARAGVEVRFMVDALYSDQEVLGRINPLLGSLAQEPNALVLAVDPIVTRKEVGVSSLKKRDHRKLIIIDGRRAFVSGRNAADEYYSGFDEIPVHDNTPHERIPWFDAHVELEGPLVREVQATFVRTWEKQGGPPIELDDDVFPELRPSGPSSGRLVVHRGLAETNGLSMYEAMFDVARRHIYIVNDFPVVYALEAAIYRAIARGVKVRLLTGSAAARRDDGTFFPAPIHRTLFEYMVKAKFEPLLRGGVEIYELVPPPSPNVVARGGRFRPYVHAKIVSIDGEVTSIGSANLDATASFWESEANLVVQDPAFAEGVESYLQKLIDGSVPLDPDSEYWKRERTQRAVVGTLWPGTFYS